MNNFWKRAITGLIFVAIVLFSILFTHSECVMFPLFCVFAYIGISEYASVVKKKGISINTVAAQIVTISLFALAMAVTTLSNFQQSSLRLLPVVVVLAGLSIPIAAIHKKSLSSFKSLIHTITPLVWVTLPLSIISAWNQIDTPIVLALTLIIWGSDTFAYCFGMLFGKHRIIERISPKKSWEGFIYSAITTVGLSTLFHYIPYFKTTPFTSMFHWWGFALVVVVFSLYGDLIESLFKRNFNVKDSGKLLPGHGGVLDRFDSFFLAVPAGVLYYLFILSAF